MKQCLIPLIVALCCLSAAHGAPKIVFHEKAYDFGDIYQPDKATHTFLFGNEGDSLLEISKVKPSCSCSVTQLAEEHKKLLPGTEGKIEVTFNSKGRHGRVHKIITVSSNDPLSPKTTLTITGNVLLHIISRPPAINLGGIAKGILPEPRTMTLKSGDGKPFEVVGVRCLSEQIAMEYERQEDGSYEVKATMVSPPTGEAKVGSERVEAFLETTHPDLPEVLVPVTWTVTKEILVDKRRVNILTEEGRAAKAESFEVYKATDGTFKVLAVEGLPACVGHQIQEVQPGRRFRITLRLGDNPPVGQILRRVIVKTDDPDNTDIETILALVVHPKPKGR